MSISFDIIVTNGLYPLIYWRINQEQNPSAASWKNMSETPVSLKSYPRSSFGRVRLLSISPQGAVVRCQTKVHNCKCSYLLLYFLVLLSKVLLLIEFCFIISLIFLIFSSCPKYTSLGCALLFDNVQFVLLGIISEGRIQVLLKPNKLI